MSEGEVPAAPSDLVELLVRNPSASFSKDLKLKISPAATIQALKERLKEEYEGHPPPSQQKLIISGQIVKDSQLLKDVLKHANLAEPQVVHLVIAGPKPDGSSSSNPPQAAPTQTPAPRFAFRPPTTHGPAAPLSQPQASVGDLTPGPPSRSTPPSRPPPPAPENPPSSSPEAAARTAVSGISSPPQTSSAAPTPARVGAPQQQGESFALRTSQNGLPTPGPQNTSPPDAQQGGPDQQATTSAPQNATPQNTTPPSAPSQGGPGPSGSGQSNGVAAAGLSQEALQQLYLQLLQSNPFLTPLACNLAALNMGLPPPLPNPGASPPLAALFPGFSFAAAPAAGQDQEAPEPQRAAPAQGGAFVGLFQAPAAAGGQAGGFVQNRAFAFPVANQGAPLQGAQIHFMHPGALPPQGFPADPAAQAGLRQRAGQNGAPQPMAQFAGIPQGVPIVVQVRRIQIDFMLIAKLAVIVFVLNQDGSIERLVLLTGLAVLAYLYQTGVLTPYVRMATERIQRLVQQQGRQQVAGGANQGAPANPGNAPNAAAGGALAGAVQRQRAGGGILREIQLFVMGFITSLLPGFQAPEGIPEPGQVPPPPGGQGGVAADDRPHRD